MNGAVLENYAAEIAKTYLNYRAGLGDLNAAPGKCGQIGGECGECRKGTQVVPGGAGKVRVS